MRLLFITSATHVDGTSGGVTYSRQVLALLRSTPDLELHVLVLPLPWAGAPHPLRQARALLRGLASSMPSKSHYLLGADAAQRLDAALAAVRPDAVAFNNSDLLPLAARLPRELPCLLFAHAVEAETIRQQVEDRDVPFPLDALLRREVRRTERVERESAHRLHTVFAICDDDARGFARYAPGLRTVVLTSHFHYPPHPHAGRTPGRPLRLGFLASFRWWPNRRAAEWLVRDLMPALPRECATLDLVGPGSEAWNGAAPGVRGRGRVPDLATVWEGCDLMLCPITAGSGLNIKLTEALYNGTPVLASPFSARHFDDLAEPALRALPLDQWPSFLASTAAETLAATAVRPETVARFGASGARATLAAALAELLPGMRPAPNRTGTPPTTDSPERAAQGMR